MMPGHIATRQLNTRRMFAAAFMLLFLAISVLFVVLGSRALTQSGQSLTNPSSERLVDVVWADEATVILERIPWLVRDSVRRSVEQSARADEVSLITRELLEELRPSFAGAR